MSSSSGGMNPRVRTLGVIILAALVGALLVARHVGAEGFTYSNWGDRDLVRTAQLGVEPQWTGAELSYGSGARIPGGIQYYLMALPLLVSDSPLTVYRFMLFLDAISVLVLFAAIRRTHGAFAAIVTCGMYVTSLIMWDNMSKLWNPGFLPLFVALGYYFLVRILADGEVRALKWVAVCLGIAAQMHFSGILLILLFVIVLVRFRPAGLRRQIPMAIVGLLIVYAHYFVAEIANDWANSRLMFQQYQVVETREQTANWANLRNMLSFFSADPPRVPGPPWVQQAAYWLANIGIAGFLLVLFLGPFVRLFRRLRDRGSRQQTGPERVTEALWLVFAIGISYYVWDLSIHLHRGGSGRYLQILLPAYCGLAGIVLAKGVAWIERSGRQSVYAVAVAATVISIALQARTLWAQLFPNPTGTLFAYNRLVSYTDDVRRSTGWSLSEFAGRTAYCMYEEEKGGWYWNPADSIDYLLLAEGEEWPGSLDPPCALLLYGSETRLAETEVNPLFLARLLGHPPTGLRVVSRETLTPDMHLVVYERDAGRCQCSFSQRYVLTPEETLLRQTYHTQPAETIVELDAGENEARRFAVMTRPPNALTQMRLAMLLDISQHTDGIRASLHSNQLRGRAYNGDYFDSAMIGQPQLVWLNLDSRKEFALPLAHDLVGHLAELTPVSADGFSLPPGDYTVYFAFQHVPDFSMALWPAAEAQRSPQRLLVTDSFRVEAPSAEDGQPQASSPAS